MLTKHTHTAGSGFLYQHVPLGCIHMPEWSVGDPTPPVSSSYLYQSFALVPIELLRNDRYDKAHRGVETIYINEQVFVFVVAQFYQHRCIQNPVVHKNFLSNVQMRLIVFHRQPKSLPKSFRRLLLKCENPSQYTKYLRFWIPSDLIPSLVRDVRCAFYSVLEPSWHDLSKIVYPPLASGKNTVFLPKIQRMKMSFFQSMHVP